MRLYRIVLVVSLALVASGCFLKRKTEFTIYNGCYGTWAEVYRGNNEKLVSRVTYGNVAPVELSAWAGTNLNFVAVVHSLADDRVVGHASDWRVIPRTSYSSGLIGADDLEIWRITQLYDSNWNCTPR